MRKKLLKRKTLLTPQEQEISYLHGELSFARSTMSRIQKICNTASIRSVNNLEGLKKLLSQIDAITFQDGFN